MQRHRLARVQEDIGSPSYCKTSVRSSWAWLTSSHARRTLSRTACWISVLKREWVAVVVNLLGDDFAAPKAAVRRSAVPDTGGTGELTSSAVKYGIGKAEGNKKQNRKAAVMERPPPKTTRYKAGRLQSLLGSSHMISYVVARRYMTVLGTYEAYVVA